MKTRYFLLMLGACLLLPSCLDKAKSDYTPQIASSIFVRNHQDTLRIHYNTTLEKNELDTIFVGDTVRFAIGFESLGNNLLTAKIGWDKACAELVIDVPESVTQAILPTSNPQEGLFNLPTGYNFMSLPITYIATKAGLPALTFTAESDSKYSPTEQTLLTPIVEK